MDVLSYQVPGEIKIGVRKAAGRQRGGEGTAAVVNVEWQNQFALIGKRFILPKRTKSKGIKVGRRPPPADNFDTAQWRRRAAVV